ncbi:MAG: aspartyl protease family protein [Gemmatimonadaceae bacterium]
MPRVGTFHTTILIESVERRGETRSVENALVDTGSEFTWVPRPILEELGIRSERLQRFLVADGRTVERSLGIAIVHAAGTNAPDFVVFAEPDDMILLGARSLEGMNLRVDAQRKQLVSAGPILAIAMAWCRDSSLAFRRFCALISRYTTVDFAYSGIAGARG